MSPQALIYVGLGVWFVGSVVFILILESYGVRKGFPITKAIRLIWQKQPWVFLWLGCSLSYLAGHLYACSP